MNVITWVVRVVILLALVWLAILNNQVVTFSVMQGLQFELPLIVLLFGFLAAGVLFGVLMVLPKNIALRWEARKLRKDISQGQAQAIGLNQRIQELERVQAAATSEAMGGSGATAPASGTLNTLAQLPMGM